MHLFYCPSSFDEDFVDIDRHLSTGTHTELLLKLLFFSEWRQTTATTKRLL
jgi:hypothetical protein